MTSQRALLFAIAIAFGAGAADAQVLFSDDFEGGASASNYTLVADTSRPAGTTGNPASDVFDAAFSFTNLGDATDVRTGTGGYFLTEDALTAFVNGVTVDGTAPISIKYDLFADPNSSGSTEYAFVGVGSGNLAFQHYLRGSLIGSEETDGVFAGGLTDSDTFADGDYVILEGSGAVGSPTDLFNADAALEAQDGTSFEVILPAGTSGPSGDVITPRILAHRWVEVELIVDGANATYKLDGSEVATVTASAPITGSIGFGIGDPFTSSNQGMRVPPLPDTFVMIDNIVIEQLAATSIPGDFDGDGDVDDDDFGVFAGAFGGAGPLGDFDNDGDVDDDDFGVFAGNFGTGVPASTSIPEPTSVAMLLGAVAVGVARRRVG